MTSSAARPDPVVTSIGTKLGRTEVIALAVGGGVLIAKSVLAIRQYADHLGTPFFDWTFYAGAVGRWQMGEPIYPNDSLSTLGAAAGSSYAYPPASVPLMLPFSSWPVGALLWEVLIVATLLAGLYAVVQVGWPDRRLQVFGLVLLALAVFPPALQGIAVANVNIATAGVLGLAWAGARMTEPASVLLAVTKVFPVALVAPFGWRAVARVLAGTAVIVLLTLPLVGVDSWVSYVHALASMTPRCGEPDYFNASLACVLAPLSVPVVVKWAGLVLGGMCLFAAVRAGRTFKGFALAALAIILPATEVHAHYLTLGFVLALIGLAEFTGPQRPADHPNGHFDGR